MNRKNNIFKVFIALILTLLLLFIKVYSIPEDESKTINYLPANIQILQENKVPILMYHYIREVDKNKDLLGYNLSITPSRFDSQLKYLKDNNYKTVTFLDLMSKPLPKNPIILTFDDGYKDFYTQAFPILQKYNFTGVLYIIPKFILNFPNRYVSMEEIKEISSYGIEIGNHTYTHADIRQLPSKSLLESIEKTQVFIKDLIGITPISFAYPAGKYTQKELDLIKETPIMFAVTTKPGLSNFADYYQLRRVRIDNRISLERFKKALDR